MADEDVSSDELKDAIKEEVYLASDADMEISLKSLRANLEKKFSMSLSSRSKEIRDLLQQVISEEDMDAEDSEEAEEAEEFESAASSSKPRTGTKRVASGVKKDIRPSQKTLANKMTRKEFGDNADDIPVHLTTVEGAKKLFMPKKFFSTGGAGWFTNGKINVPVGDQEVYCQYQYQIVVTGSKEWEDGAGYEPPAKKAKKK